MKKSFFSHIAGGVPFFPCEQSHVIIIVVLIFFSLCPGGSRQVDIEQKDHLLLPKEEEKTIWAKPKTANNTPYYNLPYTVAPFSHIAVSTHMFTYITLPHQTF